MNRSSSVRRDAAAAAVTALLALALGLPAAVPAAADEGDPVTSCGAGIVCELLPGGQQTQPNPPGPGKPTEPPSATPAPSATITVPQPPAPALPAVPAAPAPAPVPTLAPEPAVSAVQEMPTVEATASTAAPSATASPSAESNWNTPVTKSARPTQAAAVLRNDGSGLFGGPGLLATMAGVLLVGLAGLAFAWWGRNRFSSH